MALIRIENVRKRYGALDILKGFSLDIADGEFVVLVGPSGCGKSTMLKIVAGLEEASSGKVWIGARDVTDLAPGDRDIAMVFQNYALYPHLTVARNMGFGLKMRGMPTAEIERRVAEAARILEVEHLLARKPRQLSGGQRQRVALGRAIVREPAAFLMDEPLSNLDAKLRVHMRAEISALHKRLGVTTIYVTHDQIEAMTMADRIVLMREGEIQQIADPDTMYSRPANLFVAGFIGAPGMNFFTARRSSAGNGVTLFDQTIALPLGEASLAAVSGETLLLGLRPEHLGSGAGPVSFEATIALVESLGSEKYLHATIPSAHRAPRSAIAGLDDTRRGDNMIARLINPGAIPVSGPIRLSFDPANLHVFDPASGRAIR